MSVGALVAEIVVPGPPVPWARPEQNANGSRRTAKRDKGHRAAIAYCAATKPKAPPGVPLHVTLRFYLPRKGAEPLAYAAREDVDNLSKAVLDALNGITYADDRLVVSLYAQKFSSEDPRTEIRVCLVQ
jgi:Holliday junction resolvase RusA-like endonuclease